MEILRHECGVAVVRLRGAKAQSDADYGLRLVRKLMELQHNRGQEAAGLGSVAPGQGVWIEKAPGFNAISEIFSRVEKMRREARLDGEIPLPFSGPCLMGHLRYSTFGRAGVEHAHPYFHCGSGDGESLMLCGNFNLVNTVEIFGLDPSEPSRRMRPSDTSLLLGRLAEDMEREPGLDIADILRREAPTWRGGYVLAGITGRGVTWVVRDPHGIRPAYWYADDEVVTAASERVAISQALGIHIDSVRELPRGACLVIDEDGGVRLEQVMPPGRERQCSFERIYFSSASDPAIYEERKALGRALAPAVLRTLGGDAGRAVFTYVPTTAEPAFRGLVEEMERLTGREVHHSSLLAKQTLQRTFIEEEGVREVLARDAYGLTGACPREGEDTIVVVDDSIVRGTTLPVITELLGRLGSYRVIFVSSAPPVLYPDRYGIDMPTADELFARRPEGAAEAGVTIIYQELADLKRVLGPRYGYWYFDGEYP